MTQTINLQYPVELNGIKTRTLNLRRPTIGDLLDSAEGRSDKQAEVWLLANLCGVAPDDIRRLDLADYMHLQNELGKMQDYGPNESGNAS